MLSTVSSPRSSVITLRRGPHAHHGDALRTGRPSTVSRLRERIAYMLNTHATPKVYTRFANRVWHENRFKIRIS